MSTESFVVLLCWMLDALYIHINVYEAFLSHGGTSKSSYFRLFFSFINQPFWDPPAPRASPRGAHHHEAWTHFRCLTAVQIRAVPSHHESDGKKTPWNPLEKPGEAIGKIGKIGKKQNIDGTSWSMEFPAFVLSLEHLGETLIQATGMWITFGWCE